MIIEFYGLPGSGKTTLAKQISKELNIPIDSTKKRGELIFLNVKFLFLHPLSFILGFWFIVIYAGGFKRFYYKFMNSFLHTNAKYIKAKEKSSVIIDQGFFQNTISVFERAVSQEKLIKYLKVFPRPGLLVIFDIPQSIRKDRLGGRGYSAREQFGESYVRNWEKVITQNDKSFIGAVDELKVDYFFILSDDDVSKLKSKLSGLLE